MANNKSRKPGATRFTVATEPMLVNAELMWPRIDIVLRLRIADDCWCAYNKLASYNVG